MGQLLGERYGQTGGRSLNNALLFSEYVFASVSQRTLVKGYIRGKNARCFKSHK
jgi:hypothetical protein